MERTIHVLATTPGATRAAIAAAVPLARGAGARLLVLVPQALPPAIDLEGRLDSTEVVVGAYRDLVTELGGEGAVRLCLCSRPDDLSRLLPDHATPCNLRTHTSDPVPYLFFDSEHDGNGGTYSEPGVAAPALRTQTGADVNDLVGKSRIGGSVGSTPVWRMAGVVGALVS